ncbi:MAG TPA: response regulator [Terriglobales bacterium]|nr:response regulator [Terriglobales bacterium]
MKILIIDDSRLLRTSNERTLLKAGYQVITASDGEEGLRVATESNPDLIVLDMMLPKLSGPEVLRAVRKNPSTASVPIMVLSSLPESNREKLIGDGATVYFEKNLFAERRGPDAFVDEVRSLLSSRTQSKASPSA